MAAITFQDARRIVLEQLSTVRRPSVERVALDQADGRVLAVDVAADRDYPPTSRSVRDGFAVNSVDLPGTLEVVGEARAGGDFHGVVGPGQCVEIMTGAPVPEGADAIVMVEHAQHEGRHMTTDRTPKPGEFINPHGSEARKGDVLIRAGRRIGFAEIGLLATVGRAKIEVYDKPSVAILATGDEVVPVDAVPRPNQVRNSNAHTLASLVRRAGGDAVILPLAKDDWASLLPLVEKGLQHDLLLLSGGVSAGKYDIVEKALAHCGAEFFFDRVLIQPGQPVVFGKAREKFFFGLPGNPGSTMVTYLVFAKAAVEALGGETTTALHMVMARLAAPFHHKTGLTRFAPAVLSDDGLQVTPVVTQGSSDVPAVARANAYLVADAARESWSAGDLIPILIR